MSATNDDTPSHSPRPAQLRDGTRRSSRSSSFAAENPVRAVLATGAALWLAVAACAEPPHSMHTGLVGGRVLVAPGTALAGARVAVDQVNLYDGKAEIRKHVGEAVSDDQGYFAALPTGTINGLILIDASGGTYTDPVNGARIQLDSSVHLRALHWLGIFEDRSETMYVTPVHSLIEARFRYKMTILHDAFQAVDDAYSHLNAHFGGLDWETVIPADLGVASISPTDGVRAAFVLGGLAILADDIRTASNSTPQVVSIMTLVEAARRDLGDPVLDGNDGNDNAPGIGLQVGDCPPVDGTCAASSSCPIAGCRPLCDIYANTYRNLTADSIAKFIGPKISPRAWNHTSLGSEDLKALTKTITDDTDPDLFGGACTETQHRTPPTILWELAPPDGALQGREIALRVHAIDNDSNKLPSVLIQNYRDTDGNPANDFATATIDTRAATGGIDGPLTITAVATGVAGQITTSTRTFEIDNTLPQVGIDPGGLYVDGANVWWTATPGPTLHGSVTDAHPGGVQVAIGGAVVATAQVTGTQWSATLPADALSASGNDVVIVATDQVGNVATKVQTLRLDATPPSVAVDSSPVFDEINSTFKFTDDATGSFANHIPGGPPVDLATTGSCPTLHKYAHLLFAPNPDASHTVLGSSGVLNPIAVNAVVSDDGVGVVPGSIQYRVLRNTGSALVELLPWTAMTQNGVHFTASLYSNGAHAIQDLGSSNGEYHIQLQATDQFGRTTTQERCWNHVILAPPLSPTSGTGGELATGFQRALFSTKLDPGANETGDFSSKFLNISPAGAALWRTRFKNYLGLPVYVTVQISQNVSANVFREFRIMNSLTKFQSPPQTIRCGRNHCVSDPPPASITEYVSDFATPVAQAGLKFQARLFEMAGNETDAEISTCPGCTSDDNTQTYVFMIPARVVPQGGTLPEYGFLTYLRPLFPVGNGTNTTMAPSDANRPDTDPGPYSEFTFEGVTLTGKLMGTLIGPPICVEEDLDENGFLCIQVASRQRYRALTGIVFGLLENLDTTFSLSANPAISPSPESLLSRLSPGRSVWSTTEVILP
jgi:hypothetical protein